MLAPMDLLKKDRKESYEKGRELLQRVGLEDKMLSYPDELSGGQKQRVAIARTLCMEPEIILLDEPTSALDPTMVSEVQAVIRDLSQSGKTMLIVTHEMTFARAISNRVFYMDEGGIYEEGTPDEIFDHPQKELTRRFIRKLKIFEETITSKGYDFIGFHARLDSYFRQNDISGEAKYRIRLAIEETVQQIIFSEYETPDINVMVEYSVRDQSSHVTIKYTGKQYDIRNSDNTLSLTLLLNTVGDITYRYDEDKKDNFVEIWVKS